MGLHPWDAMTPQTAELFRAMMHMMRAWQSITPSGGLSRTQFITLAALAKMTHHCDARQEDPTVGALAGMLHVSPAAVSQNLRSLEDMGYIQRNIRRADRRVTSVQLTAKGGDILAGAFADVAHELDEALAQVPEINVSDTTRNLEHIAAVLDTIAKEKSEC